MPIIDVEVELEALVRTTVTVRIDIPDRTRCYTGAEAAVEEALEDPDKREMDLTVTSGEPWEPSSCRVLEPDEHRKLDIDTMTSSTTTTTPRQERHVYVQGWVTLLMAARIHKHDVKMSSALAESAWLKVLWVEDGDVYEINVLAHAEGTNTEAEYKSLWVEKNGNLHRPDDWDWCAFLDLPDEMLKSLAFQMSMLTKLDGVATQISPDLKP